MFSVSADRVLSAYTEQVLCDRASCSQVPRIVFSVIYFTEIHREHDPLDNCHAGRADRVLMAADRVLCRKQRTRFVA